MPAKIKTDEKIYRKFCAHCLDKESAPVGKKETPEEKYERELRNDKNTLIYEVITTNGKITKVTGTVPFIFEKYPYHEKCLMAWLQKKFKKDKEKINAAYQDVVRRREKTIDASRKKGKLSSSEMRDAKSTRANRERLINYFMGHYGASVLSKKVQTTIKDLDEGKSKTFNNIVVHYDELLDMFLYYQDKLMGIYKAKIKKGEQPTNASQRILYDISVVMLDIDEYNSRKENKYNQQDQRTDEELLDVKKYIQTDFQKEKVTAQEDEEIKKAREYAEEVTKEFDYDNDEFLQELLDGIISKEGEQK